MRIRDLTVLAALSACSCRGGAPQGETGPRLAVFGPSLVELACEGGIGHLVCGVDRYTTWPSELDSLPRLGGYLDPSTEALVMLRPTDVMSVGRNPDLSALCTLIGAEYHSFSFDTFEDVMAAADSLEAGWGADLSGYRADLETTMDSIRTSIGAPGPSVVVVVWHETGDGMMTLAGHGTWYEGLCERIGLDLLAPEAGSYPAVSVEGVVCLSPDYILHLFPGMAADSADIAASEREFWSRAAFPGEHVLFAFEDFIMIPGSRLALIARRFGTLCSS